MNTISKSLYLFLAKCTEHVRGKLLMVWGPAGSNSQGSPVLPESWHNPLLSPRNGLETLCPAVTMAGSYGILQWRIINLMNFQCELLINTAKP